MTYCPRFFAKSLPLGLLLTCPAVLAAPYQLSSDGNAVVRVTPTSVLSSSSFNSSLVTAAFPGWTVTKAGSAPGGNIAVTQYDAGWSGNGGGAKLLTSYSQTNAVGAGQQLHYLQFVDTNLPLGGSSTPYIDPRPNDDTLPFYWTTSEVASRSTNKTVTFSDFSRRDKASLTTTDPIEWSAELYQVEYDGATSITVRDGISWGWTMKPATAGSATGTFSNPAPTCPPATCSGLGTSSVSWGIGESGSLSFAGASFAPEIGTPFKLGSLTYHNGATQVGSSIDGIELDFDISFDNVPELNFTYNTRLQINNTLNTDDPIASADFVSFATGGFSSTFNVLEGSTATVDLMVELTPVLNISPSSLLVDIPSFGDKDFFTDLDAPLFLGFDAKLVALANPSPGGFVGNVPAPPTWALVVLMLTILGMHRRGVPSSLRPMN
jgi:hypothetical protein